MRLLWQTQALVCLLMVIPVCLFSQTPPSPGIAPGTDLKKILNKPEALMGEVDSFREGGEVWITMEADAHIATEMPLAKIRAAVTDYQNYVNMFRRTTASVVANSTEDSAELFMQVTVGALGIVVVNNYTVLMKIEIDEPGRFLLTFTQISSDGNIRDVYGYWYLESVEIDGKPCTYFRYYNTTTPKRQNRLQKTATAMFIDTEYRGMLREAIAWAKGK